ncbi:hypothetical protein LCGC14_1324680 [marine sediment metagenome]|uniref:Uncharacterized protein n=1 Tax=marine sediment metagenome TaxID=412755 RepID=A0A0F9KIJ3_9ZZZZ|nr:MAG: hypothetical protein Lokiarch_26270 [Candidatus Lokiarchaeum sp. GC14_75]
MSFKRYSHCPSCDNFLIIVPNHFKTCPVCELQKESKQVMKMKKSIKSELQTVS